MDLDRNEEGWKLRKENIIYMGIDLHKKTHPAVTLDCWNQKLGEFTIKNKPSVFSKRHQTSFFLFSSSESPASEINHPAQNTKKTK